MAEINAIEVRGALNERCVKNNSQYKRTKFELKRSIDKQGCNGSIEHIIELSRKYLSDDQVKFLTSLLTMSKSSRKEKSFVPTSSDINFVHHLKSVGATLLSYRADGFLCDTVLELSDKVWKAHSVLLSASSPVFRAAFDVNGKAGMHYIRLPGVDSAVMEIALNFIYTGMLRLPWRYTRPTELPKLFAQLNHLGLSAEKLNGCEVIFLSEEGSIVKSDSAAAVPSTNVKMEQPPTAGVINPDITDTVQAKCIDSVIDQRNPILSDAKFNANPKTKRFPRYKRRPLFDASNKAELNKNVDKLCCSENSFESNERVCVIDDDDDLGTIECTEIVNARESEQMISSSSVDPSDAVTSSDEITVARFHSEQSRTSENTDGRRRVTNSISRRKRPPPKKTHLCAMCGYAAATPAHLRYHNRTHSLERPYICKICKSSFTSSSNLDRHVKRHTGVRTHLCHLCGKGFIQKTGYDDHMLVHAQDYAKLFSCDQCDATFNRVGNLRVHVKSQHSLCGMLNHDNSTTPSFGKNKPFLCDLCGRSFASKASLNLHGMFHRGVKAFACPACTKCFVLKSQLDLHMRTHNGVKPYVCVVCEKAFAMKGSLDRHARIHSGEKPYVCMTCGNQFRQSGHLKAHMLKHAGEKPYRCETCGRLFKEIVRLRSHCERAHKTVASSEISS